MQMPRFVIKWLRQRRADEVVRVGRKRRELMIQLAQMTRNEVTAPDYDYLVMEVERLTRRRQRLVEFLKTTAQEAHT
jgi:hypothetical protein